MSTDPRTIQNPTRVGTPLRDAAVDPAPGDFLPPVNAGKSGEEGNPHGPNVYSPEIHASQGIRPVLEGAVSPDPAVQSAAESAHATTWQGVEEPPEEPDEPEDPEDPEDPEEGTP